MKSERASKASERQHKHQRAMTKSPGDDAAVSISLRIKPVVKPFQYPSDTAPFDFLMTRWISPIRREHWIERKRNQ